MTKAIVLHPLSVTASALVDDEDFARFGGYVWHSLRKRSGKTYAMRGKGLDGKGGACLLHRLIMNAPKGVQVDHINGDSLDNRKENLRLCSAQENARNRQQRKDVKAPFKGVQPTGNRFSATLTENGISISLGTYETAADAARAYDAEAVARFGEFARTNFQRKAA